MSGFNQSRSTVIKLIFFVAFFILLARLFQFQILSQNYGALSDMNAYVKKSTWPDRGLLLDRNGTPMVKNITVYDAYLTVAGMKGFDTLSFCRIMDIDTAEFNKRMIGLKIKAGNKNKPGVFQRMLSFDIYSRLGEKLYNFPGLELVQRTERSYPFDAGGIVFGYLNEVDSNAIKRSKGELTLGDYTGISGLERIYDPVLRGKKGVEIFLRDNKQRIVERYADGKYDTLPVAGRNLKTTMDIKLQQLGEKLMKNKWGAAVAINPKNGGILAMASGPGFDPNLLSGYQKKINIGLLTNDVTRKLYNFATQGEYAPGSTFKPLGALVALDEGVMTASSGVGCGGRYVACGGKGVACHGGGHGGNLRSAMAASCNSYFITTFRKALDNENIANTQAGYMKWKEYMNNFGLGHKLGIDLPSERGGNIPDTGGKRGLNRSIGSKNWGSCAIGTMGIGQDRMLTTPLQMANAMCIIANRGYYYIPHFVDSIDGETKSDTILHKYRKKIKTVNIADTAFDAVFDGMEAVVTGGTARRSRIPGIAMCGKTGTAENFFKGVKYEEHSWFVAFAPKEDPKIAIAVAVLNAGQGGQYAAPIASLMVEQYLTDTVKRKSLMNSMANATIYPKYLKQLKFEQDSTRAYDRFEATGDSSYIDIYLPEHLRSTYNDSLAKIAAERLRKQQDSSKNKIPPATNPKKADAVLPNKNNKISNPKQKDSTKR
jgi:penicillin-binding protein 2